MWAECKCVDQEALLMVELGTVQGEIEFIVIIIQLR